MNRCIAFLIAFVVLASLPGCAVAQPLVDMQVMDLDRQETLPRHPHRGRDYVEGQPGHRYAVVLQNLTGERVLAVVSVDGVNAISGQTAGSQQGGYVLQPWQRLEVRGWRKNLSEVAEFQFTSLGDSYAARTGRPGNVGVIGVAAFRERRVAWTPPYDAHEEIAPAPQAKPRSRDDYAGAVADSANSASAPSASSSGRAYESESRRIESAPAQRQQLGTGHGQRRWDAASTTTFDRESAHPNQVLSIWYDSGSALVARGILPARWNPYYGTPEAFPVGFAPDP